jgi:hypothetical protein
VLLVASSSGFAQQRNLNPIGTNGNILSPGIPLSGPPAHVPAVRPQENARRSHRPSSFSGGAIFVPYPVGNAASGYTVHNPAPGMYDPIFGGYTPVDSFAAGYPPQMAPAPAPTPMVVINQNFLADPVRPQFRDYSNVQLPEPGVTIAPPAPPSPPAASAAADDQPVVFLIALRDHTIVPAVAYWLQGDTLNYITLQGAQNQVSVTLVDRDFSKQLNAERNVPFRLPAAQ